MSAFKVAPFSLSFAVLPVSHLHAPPPEPSTLSGRIPSYVKDVKLTHARLVMMRSEFLNWGTPGAQASVTTKDELRGWIRALDWVLGKHA